MMLLFEIKLYDFLSQIAVIVATSSYYKSFPLSEIFLTPDRFGRDIIMGPQYPFV